MQAEELIASGHQLLATRHYCPLECVQPKCSELQRVCTLLRERLEIRRQTLEKCHHLQEQVDRVIKKNDIIIINHRHLVKPLNCKFIKLN